MPKKSPPEGEGFAVRMVRAHQQDYPAMTPVAGAVAKQLGPCSALGNQDSPAAPADDQPPGALGRDGRQRQGSAAPGLRPVHLDLLATPGLA